MARIPHEDTVWDVRFSPDGRYVATASLDNTSRVWDLTTNREVARIPHEDEVSDVRFSPDGRYLLTRSGNVAEVWFLQADDLINAACSRLNRNLTVQEWQQFIGDEPYRRTCDNLDYPDDYEPPVGWVPRVIRSLVTRAGSLLARS